MIATRFAGGASLVRLRAVVKVRRRRARRCWRRTIVALHYPI
jgi:hypothetical protein